MESNKLFNNSVMFTNPQGVDGCKSWLFVYTDITFNE